MLDVLHYFSDEDQQQLLRKIAASIASQGVALIRLRAERTESGASPRPKRRNGSSTLHDGFPCTVEISRPAMKSRCLSRKKAWTSRSDRCGLDSLQQPLVYHQAQNLSANPELSAVSK